MTTSLEGKSPHIRPEKHVQVKIDGEDALLPSREITPNEILSLLGLDPASHYLVEVQGRHQNSYQGAGDEIIRVHNNQVFISLSTGPTPTS
jgi:hypothetical protein